MPFSHSLQHNEQRIHPTGQLIQFTPRKPLNQTGPACIFCGQTVKVHTFKGKTVCQNCLKHIPELFMYG